MLPFALSLETTGDNNSLHKIWVLPVSPADDVGEAGVSVMAFQQDHFATVPLAAGEMAEMERLAMQLEATQAEQGDLALLNAAWLVGQGRGMIPSGRGLFVEVEQPETEYYFGYGVGPSNSPALEAVKTWEVDGERRFDTLTVGEYGSFDEAAVDERELEMLLKDEGLEAAMHQAERMAEAGGYLDANRDDPRIFFENDAPPDPFVTNREMAIDAELDRYGVTWREVQEWENEPPEVENPYWRWDTLPVNDLSGKPLGHALHMVVYDGVEHDADRVGTPAIPEDEPFRMLEVAHFETQAAADQFGKAFNGYLMPGVLDATELAEEVAQSNGYEAEWRTLNGQELDDYRNLNLTLIRDPADWHPYDQDHAIDVEFETEEMLYIDPIHQCLPFDKDIEL